MGGFLYTNRQSLSVGLVLPADNLHEHFGGDPNLLMEWFENLPALQPWLKDGAARRLRGQDHPRRRGEGHPAPDRRRPGHRRRGQRHRHRLPLPELHRPGDGDGPAARRRPSGDPRRGRRLHARRTCDRHYLEPLQRATTGRTWSSCAAGPATSRRRRSSSAATSTWPWAAPTSGPGPAGGCREAGRTGSAWCAGWPGRAARSCARRREQPDARPCGSARWPVGRRCGGCCSTARSTPCATCSAGRAAAAGGGRGQAALPRWRRQRAGRACRRRRCAAGSRASPRCWRRRPGASTPTMTCRCRRQAAGAVAAPARQVNLLDLLRAGRLALASAAWRRRWDRLRLGSATGTARPTALYDGLRGGRPPDDRPDARRRARGAGLGGAAGRLGLRDGQGVAHPRPVAAGPGGQGRRSPRRGLWHVCPAHVYEARASPAGQVQVVVNFENCIKCETCWRTSDLVDWGRDGRHRFVYPVHSPAVGRLLDADRGGRPGPPRRAASRSTPWERRAPVAAARTGRREELAAPAGPSSSASSTSSTRPWTEEPRTLDRDRADYLECWPATPSNWSRRDRGNAAVGDDVPRAWRPRDGCSHWPSWRLERAAAWAAYSWAAADGRQLR